jgi:hypothetical protein
MLASLLGIRLLILTGTGIPLPVSRALLDALVSVDVHSDPQAGDGFALTFTLARSGPGRFGVLDDGELSPGTRTVIAVVMGVLPVVLIDGIVTQHDIEPGEEPGSATLTVTGRDLTYLMDLVERNKPFANRPDMLIFTEIVADYAQYGLVPQPSPTNDVPIELQRTPRQHETDLQFIRRMAERNGFVFFIDYQTIGVSTAYFGPENRLGIPQTAIGVNTGEPGDARDVHFTFDAAAPVGTSGIIVEPLSKIPLPIPVLPSLKIPPLAASPATAVRTNLAREVANKDPVQAALALLATSSSAPDAVKGTCELETLSYGGIVRPRALIGLRGAGLSYDGIYFVTGVAHAIAKGSYTQRVSFSREGLETLLPAVPA